MKIIIDTDAQTLATSEAGSEERVGLYTKSAFETVSRQWLRIGWSLSYFNNFAWLGHAIRQFPEDLVRVQEVIYRLKPDVIIETGVFQGGSLIFNASICEAIKKGRVVGVDINVPRELRERIAGHNLAQRISLIEGDSRSPEVVAKVAAAIHSYDEVVMVILDSAHTSVHVRRELEAYSHFVTPGSYIVVQDASMEDLANVPGGSSEWRWDHPGTAANEFLACHSEFIREQPPWTTHWGELTENVTCWPGGWLRKQEPNSK